MHVLVFKVSNIAQIRQRALHPDPQTKY